MIFSLLISLQTLSQTLSLNPNEVFAKCPNEWIIYTVTNTSTAACSYDWTVTNGEIQGGFLNGNVSTFTGGTLIQIKWFDVTTSGSVKAVANCNPSTGNGQRTWTIPILSINGVNPGAITPSSAAIANVTTNITYSVPQINFPNIGTGDVNPKQVGAYEWQIPTGWTVISGSTTKSIVVRPDNCSGGVIRVRGINTSCTSAPSNWSSLTISRTLPTPSAITGASSVTCGSSGTLTYSISSVTGAESYEWTIPSGWTGTSTTNSISVTPNNINAGTISVKAKACNGTALSSASTLSIAFNNPALSTPVFTAGSTKLLCSSGSGSVSVNAITNAANYTWYTTGGSFYLNGVVVTSSNPVTTTSTTVNISVPSISGSNGYNNIVYVKANRAVSTCAGSPMTSKNVWAGKPVLPAIVVDDTDCPEYYFSACPLIDQSITSYTWQYNQLPSGTIYTYPNSTCNSRRFVLNSGYSYRVGAFGINTCGSGQFSVTTVSVSCGGSALLSVYPNPSTSSITVELASVESTEESFEIEIIDSNGNARLRQSGKGKKAEVALENLEKGRYYLNVKTSNGVIRETILIE